MTSYPYRRIFLKNILHNFKTIQKVIAPAKVMAVIKSDAYGHNMLKVAQLLENRADYFLVDRVQDAIYLRKQKITSPIFLSSLFFKDIPLCVEHNIEFVLCDFTSLEFLEQNQITKTKIHIKIDSGMGRLGFSCKEYNNVLQRILALKHVTIKGVCSHFAMAENKQHIHNQEQIKNFQFIIQKTQEYNLHGVLFHLANSAGIINFSTAHHSMVRTGLLLYGVYHAGYSHLLDLKPAMEVVSNIFSVKKILKGSGVSYSHSWRAQQTGNLAFIAVGYGDGFKRSLTNKAEISIAGKKYPTVGNICMGTTAVFLGQDCYNIGQEVMLVGEQISIEDLAYQGDSISHEFLSSLAQIKNYYFV